MSRTVLIPLFWSRMTRKGALIIIGIVLLLAVGGGSFYGGTLYGKTQALAAIPGRLGFAEGDAAAPGGGAPGLGGGRFQVQGTPGARANGMAGMTFGQVESVEGNTLIVAGQQGQKVKVIVTDTTLVEKYASVTASELEVGETVMVSGSTGADGTITARSIQAAPAGRFGGQPPASGGNQ